MTTVTFAPGETQQFVDVDIVDNSILEGVEMFTATLTTTDSNVNILPDADTATVTINDNDSRCCGGSSYLVNY